jgi:hypothetical protein
MSNDSAAAPLHGTVRRPVANYLTAKEIKSVPCPRCGADAGERCLDARYAMTVHGNLIPRLKSFHVERKDKARDRCG